MQWKKENCSKMNLKNKEKSNKQKLKILSRKSIWLAISIVILTFLCIFINNNKIEKTKIVKDIKGLLEVTANEEESPKNEITDIDLTGLVTGEDVNHTHIYEKNVMIYIIGKNVLYVEI